MLLSVDNKNPLIFLLAGKRQKKEAQKRMMIEYLESTDEPGDKNIEFPFINFNDIIAATDNFSDSNMLGKGGFGNVYKVRVLKEFSFFHETHSDKQNTIQLPHLE